MIRLTLRIDPNEDLALGPGKVRMLALIGETGSISAVSRTVGIEPRCASDAAYGRARSGRASGQMASPPEAM